MRRAPVSWRFVKMEGGGRTRGRGGEGARGRLVPKRRFCDGAKGVIERALSLRTFKYILFGLHHLGVFFYVAGCGNSYGMTMKGIPIAG